MTEAGCESNLDGVRSAFFRGLSLVGAMIRVLVEEGL